MEPVGAAHGGEPDIGVDHPLNGLRLVVAGVVVIVAGMPLRAPGGVLGRQHINARLALRDRLADREERRHGGVLGARDRELALPCFGTLGVPDLVERIGIGLALEELIAADLRDQPVRDAIDGHVKLLDVDGRDRNARQALARQHQPLAEGDQGWPVGEREVRGLIARQLVPGHRRKSRLEPGLVLRTEGETGETEPAAVDLDRRLRRGLQGEEGGVVGLPACVQGFIEDEAGDGLCLGRIDVRIFVEETRGRRSRRRRRCGSCHRSRGCRRRHARARDGRLGRLLA